MTWASVAVIISAFILTRSQTAHASLLSFLDSILGNQASADTALPGSASSIQDDSYSVFPDPIPACDASSTVPISGDGESVLPQAAQSASCGSDQINTSISTYVVQKDDNLSSIALMFGVSVDTIKQANGLANNDIQPGQSLTILPIDGVLYTVKSGDSIGSIAKKFGSSQDDIVTYNSTIDPKTLIILPGEQLVIPHGAISAVKAKSYLSSEPTYHGSKVPSFEPLLDPVWDWPIAPDGYYSCPLPGSIETQGLHGHDAVDLAAPYGTPIHASAAGTIIVSKNNGYYGRSSNGGYGNFVMISHGNGSETLYAHMSKTAVSVGEYVSKGQVIGYVGMTGMTTGPHVHFEVRKYQNPFVDPNLCR